MPDAATTIKLRWPGSITFVGEVPGTSHEHDSPVESQPQPLSAESKGAASTTDRGLRIISVHNDTADACGQEKVFYEPLIAHKIRLLRLSAAERHHDPIHIDIRLTDLTSGPKFEALSYTWADNDGDDSKCDRVYVGKHWDILPVTRNCASALRRLRFPYRERDLWVDAICIDQRNKQERSHQVGIMQYIYAAAVRVLIYLGEDSKDPDGLNPVPWTDGKYIHRPLASPSTLAENPYFRRVWVIQEIAAARDAWVLYGSRGARWHDFLGVTNSETDSNRNRDLSLSIDRPMTREKLPKWLYICNKPRYMELDRLLYVLYAAAQCKASDLRDKVFAILGLFHGANNAKLVADYTLCHQEVAIGVTAYIFVNHTEQMWRIFAAIDSKDSHVMPSWVMDWSSETKVKRLGPYMAETKPIVEAEGKQSQPLYIPRIYRNGSLVLKGRLVTQAGSCAFNHGARDGPPGVVTDIVYQQSIIWHLQSDSRPMVPSGWCQSTDEIFAVQSLSGYCLILRPIMTNPETYRLLGQSLAKKKYFQKRRQPLMNQKIHNGNLHLRTRDLIYWQIASQLDETCLNRKTLERLEYIARSAERDLPRYLNLSNYTSETYNYASEIKTHHLYDIFHFIIKSIPTTQKSLLRARWEWGLRKNAMKSPGAKQSLDHPGTYIDMAAEESWIHLFGHFLDDDIDCMPFDMPSSKIFVSRLLYEGLEEKVFSLHLMFSKGEDPDKKPQTPQYKRMVQWLLDFLNLEPNSGREDLDSRVDSVEDTWGARFLEAWSNLMEGHRPGSFDDAEPPERQEASDKGYLADAKAKWAPLLDLVRETEAHLYPLQESFLQANQPMNELRSEAVWEDIVIV
ncbi:hypothetical protein CABS03_02278 [Colletotrichum abscissum]|uniref:Heterokaryon incompatibility domain-containing protein n=1 Tax=Colletotrichum abscissum TaxID=1671311 RepID=A0A9Q0B0S2_9PEZI|nr:hypothetical protein CABS02_10930 [Colletotrichum abscissum]